MHPILKQLADCGQSIWYDNIRRGMLKSGDMQRLIDDGVTGVTSNPSIFQKAITDSSDYDEAMARLIAAGADTPAIYDALVLDDIRNTADLFRPIYDKTNGWDGYVSIECDPRLAYDTEGTIVEAQRLYDGVSRPNVMIKIPGTEEGLPAIEATLSKGINVNVTLIFSTDVYVRVMERYVAGVGKFIDAGGRPDGVASVASFFVSRVDTLVDEKIKGKPELADLAGQAAVANTKIAYKRYQEFLGGRRFGTLKARGARPQRPLWGSTSTKNPAYSPTIYVDTLIGPDTVNTVPPVTLDAIRAGMKVATTITEGLDAAQRVLNRLEAAGISMDEVTEDLRTAGVKAFADAFDKLIRNIEARAAATKV